MVFRMGCQEDHHPNTGCADEAWAAACTGVDRSEVSSVQEASIKDISRTTIVKAVRAISENVHGSKPPKSQLRAVYPQTLRKHSNAQ